MNSLTAVIADDEDNLAQHLKTLLNKLWPELDIVGIAHSGKEALSIIGDTAPDIVFLDIRMPEVSGLDVAPQLDPNIRIVFVTAYDEYSVKAFEHAAVDYLVKPVGADRLQKTIDRLKDKVGQGTAIPSNILEALVSQIKGKQPEYLQWLRVGSGDITELVSVDKVIYLKASEKYISVFTKDREHLIRKPIKEIEGMLNPNQFWRIHRSTLVNVSEIKNARRDLRGRYSIVLKSRPETLNVSQTFSHLFKNM